MYYKKNRKPINSREMDFILSKSAFYESRINLHSYYGKYIIAYLLYCQAKSL